MAKRAVSWLLLAPLSAVCPGIVAVQQVQELQPQLTLQMSPEGSCGAFSRDGRFIATGGVLWETATGREIRSLGPPAGIDAVAFSPDARYLVGACSSPGGLVMWETGSGKEVWRASGGTSWAGSLAFTPDGRYVATGGNDHLARLLDAATGKEIRRFEGHNAYTVACVIISADGRFLLSGSSDSTARLWDLETGKELRRTPEQPGRVRAVAFSRDALYFLTSAYDNKVHLWETATMKEVRTFEAGEEVWSVAFSPTGKQVLTGGAQHVSLWETDTGKRIRDFPRHPDTTCAVAFSPDGRLALAAGLGSAAWLWEVASGNVVRILESAGYPPTALAYSPDGRHLLVGSADRRADATNTLTDKPQGVVHVWDLAIGRSVRRLANFSSPATALVFSTDGNIVAAATKDGKVRTLRFSDGKERHEFSAGAEVAKLELPGNGRLVVATEYGNDQKLHIWEEDSGQELGVYLALDAVSPDGQFVLTSALNKDFLKLGAAAQLANYSRLDSFAHLYETASGKEVRKFGPHAGLVHSRAFSPDGRYVVTGARNTPHRLWETASGREVQRYAGFQSEGGPVAFSPDGRFLLAGKESNFVQGEQGGLAVWETQSGKPVARLAASAKWAWFLPDGRVLAMNIYREASLWDVATGKLVSQIDLHTALRDSLAISPDSRFIAAGYGDKSVLLYDSATGKALCTLINFREGSQAVIEPEGRFDSSNLEEPLRISWLMPDDPMRPLGPEIFLRDYYEPQLLPRLLQAEKFLPVRPLANLNRAQPQASIVAIRLEEGSRDSVAITVELSSGEYRFERNGQPVVHKSSVYDVRLFRDGQLVGRLPNSEAALRTEPKPGDLSDASLHAWQDTHLVKLDAFANGKPQFTFHHVRLPHSRAGQSLEFSAYAFNSDRVKSETSRMSFTVPQDIPISRRRAYLITMGVNACQDPNWDLWFAAPGAREVRGLLDQKLQRTGHFDVVPITLLSDYEEGGAALVERTATKASLKHALDCLAGLEKDPAGKLLAATPDDLVLLYLSSHGYAAPDGTFYIVPFDTGEPAGVSEERLTAVLADQPGTAPSSGGRHSALAFLGRCVSSDELTQWLRSIDAGEMDLILDSCHAAGVAGRAFKPGPMGDRGFGQLAYDKAMRVLTATQADNVAVGPLVLKQSLLTHALLHPTNGETTFALKDWLQQAVDQVPQLCRQYYPGFEGKVQRPILFDYQRTSQLAARR